MIRGVSDAAMPHSQGSRRRGRKPAVEHGADARTKPPRAGATSSSEVDDGLRVLVLDGCDDGPRLGLSKLLAAHPACSPREPELPARRLRQPCGGNPYSRAAACVGAAGAVFLSSVVAEAADEPSFDDALTCAAVVAATAVLVWLMRRRAARYVLQRCVGVVDETLRTWRPHLVLGVGVGGAVACALADVGAWRGPTLLIESAAGLEHERGRGSAGYELAAGMSLSSAVLLHGTGRAQRAPLQHSRDFVARHQGRFPCELRELESPVEDLSVASVFSHILFALQLGASRGKAPAGAEVGKGVGTPETAKPSAHAPHKAAAAAAALSK